MTTTLRHAARPFQSRTAATIDLGAGSRPRSARCATMATMTAPSAPPPLHLVLGDEELLVERAVRAIVDAARAVDPDGRGAAPPGGRGHARGPGRGR